MNRTTTALLAATVLALAGCSAANGDDPKPTVTVTKTSAPKLTAAEKHQACVDAWTRTIKARPVDFDSDTDHEEYPTECEGLPDGLEMYSEASFAIAEANRASLEACLDEPTCTSWPLPTH